MRHGRSARFVTGAMALVLTLAACSGGGGGGSSSASAGTSGSNVGAGKTVNIAINPWVGYEADAAVVAWVLENQLGYKVAYKNLKEEIAWQGFSSGDVDVVLENWGHPELVTKYIETDKVAVDAGQTGNKGIIGWYVPPWLATEHPDVLDWNNLNKYADQFKTTESGGKGQILDGDPSFVTNDEALVANLGLNYKVVYAGSEASLIEAFRTAEQQKKWLIGYFYEPQWFLLQVPLKKVTLPAYKAGCDADPKKVNCDYPPYDLNKIAAKKFIDDGSPASQVIKNFSWTNEDQNKVADLLTNKYVSEPDQAKRYAKAAEEWAKANEATWKKWLPAS